METSQLAYQISRRFHEGGFSGIGVADARLFTTLAERQSGGVAQQGPDPCMERALLLLGLDTGCRIGELCMANVEDLDLEAGSILFRTTKNGRPQRVFFRVAGQPDGGPCVVALQE